MLLTPAPPSPVRFSSEPASTRPAAGGATLFGVVVFDGAALARAAFELTTTAAEREAQAALMLVEAAEIDNVGRSGEAGVLVAGSQEVSNAQG